MEDSENLLQTQGKGFGEDKSQVFQEQAHSQNPDNTQPVASGVPKESHSSTHCSVTGSDTIMTSVHTESGRMQTTNADFESLNVHNVAVASQPYIDETDTTTAFLFNVSASVDVSATQSIELPSTYDLNVHPFDQSLYARDTSSVSYPPVATGDKQKQIKPQQSSLYFGTDIHTQIFPQTLTNSGHTYTEPQHTLGGHEYTHTIPQLLPASELQVSAMPDPTGQVYTKSLSTPSFRRMDIAPQMSDVKRHVYSKPVNQQSQSDNRYTTRVYTEEYDRECIHRVDRDMYARNVNISSTDRNPRCRPSVVDVSRLPQGQSQFRVADIYQHPPPLLDRDYNPVTFANVGRRLSHELSGINEQAAFDLSIPPKLTPKGASLTTCNWTIQWVAKQDPNSGSPLPSDVESSATVEQQTDKHKHRHLPRVSATSQGDSHITSISQR